MLGSLFYGPDHARLQRGHLAAGAGETDLNVSPDKPWGAHPDGEGTFFRLWSSCAERVELCLHAPDGRETHRQDLEASGEGAWGTYCPGVGEGQHYGFRVHGPWSPDEGLRCNPAKLLLDPYARRLHGDFHWSAAVHDYDVDAAPRQWLPSTLDSAPYVPRSVVCESLAPLQRQALARWSASIIYETNVRGFTMQHPGLSAGERGRFAGLSNGEIISYLKALGITTIELQPVHSWIDEYHLATRGLRNYWGYNSVGFFAPDQRLAGNDPVNEFRAMTTSLHEAGFEVMLDVAYNHTGEGDGLGPSLSFRGIDNLAYYRVEAGDPGIYVNQTGCGNTLNADHPKAQDLVIDSLVYWHQAMGVDGFRFDLAPILGVSGENFSADHPLLERMGAHPDLGGARLVAEPWGPAHYELGRFPSAWGEWNDRCRDALRTYWGFSGRGIGDLRQRIEGSPDLFQGPDRGPENSVNFVCAHDGFTLMDLVSYTRRHNEANGEENRDGHTHNLSVNHGEEGPTDRPVIEAFRRRHRLNLLATLLLSRGVPMLLAGDELGNSQAGNNNAYAQDNETGWIDWSALNQGGDLLAEVQGLIALRKRLSVFFDSPEPGSLSDSTGEARQCWIHPRGNEMSEEDWRQEVSTMYWLTRGEGSAMDDSGPGPGQLALVLNGADAEVDFILPDRCDWQLAYATDGAGPASLQGHYRAPAWSISLLLSIR